METDEATPLVGRKGASVTETILNLSKTCMGTGCLGLAYACSEGGLVVYILGLIGIGAWNVVAVQRLCRCLEFLPDMGTSRSPPPVGTAKLGTVAWYAFGRNGLQALDVMMIILLFGIIVAYVSAVVAFLGDTPFSINRWIDSIMAALVMSSIAMVPDVGHLSGGSAVGLGILAVTFLVIAGYGAASYHESSSSLVVWPASAAGLSHFFGICVFGFGVVPLTYNFRDSMREPNQMVPATAIALSSVAVAYIVVGLGLYACYPDIEGDVLHELPSGILPVLTRLAMSVVVFMTAPLLIVPCGELLEGKFGLSQSTLVRYGIGLVGAAIAVLLPSFVQVLALVGSACVGLVSFCLPPLLHWKLSSHQASTTRSQIFFDVILFVWGVMATVLSTVISLQRSSG